MIINTKNRNPILAYKGPFCIDILSSFGNYIKQLFNSSPQTCNRLYKLFFELTQNVAKYSAETLPIKNCRFSGIGTFTIEETEASIILTTSNLIKNSHSLTLIKYCTDINSMNRNELRKFKIETRRITPDSNDIGAHIGIIQVGILTYNNIDFEIEKIDQDHSLFTICATINKI
jgi:hypothetical protein